jgi:short-subunit dehydrogenase
VRTAAVDVGSSSLGETLGRLTEGLEVGLLVYNAAFSPVGPFLERPLAAQLQAVDVNVRGTLQAVSALAPAMVARGKGGIILLSSLTAFQGSPWVSTYGGTKAFLLSFGEGLWAELKEKGVDVLVSCAGATSTPGLLAQSPQGAPFMLPPRAVADDALGKLGRGPTTIPGAMNRLASFFMRRLLPRRMTVQLMSSQTKKLKSA